MLTKNYYNNILYGQMAQATNIASYKGPQESDIKFVSLRDYGGNQTEYGYVPLVNLGSAGTPSSGIYPDLTSAVPTINDYSMSNPFASNPTFSAVSRSFKIDSFDVETAEYTCTLTTSYTNTATTDKIVYGVYLYSRNNNTTFLMAREQFAAPVTVPSHGTIDMTLTMKFSKAGLLLNANGGV